MKWDRDRWIAEILFHLAMVLAAFTAGLFLAVGERQDIAVGIYLASATVCTAGLHLYTEWRSGS